jgi:hypothetical protein
MRVSGDIDDGKHVRFMRLVMERAVRLELPRVGCQGRVRRMRRRPAAGPVHRAVRLPGGQEGVDALVRRQVKGGIATSARVLVYTASKGSPNGRFLYQYPMKKKLIIRPNTSIA